MGKKWLFIEAWEGKTGDNALTHQEIIELAAGAGDPLKKKLRPAADRAKVLIAEEELERKEQELRRKQEEEAAIAKLKEQAAAVKACCRKPENLIVQDSDKPELVIRKCRVCGCRHFELTMDPGLIGLQGENL